MKSYSLGWLLLVGFLVTLSLPNYSQAFWGKENKIKTAVFKLPKVELRPGYVSRKWNLNVEFPKGHIALKSFNAELVDVAGNSVPLYDAYLHHWVVIRYFVRKGVEVTDILNITGSDVINGRNAGLCQDSVLDQFFGLGSETRKTATDIPDPYGIEIGNPNEIPEGFEEKWAIQVHAIDTRGVEDRMGCTECRCNLYNITTDAQGNPLSPGYNGGLLCCLDNTQCRMKQGFEDTRRAIYLKYTVKWVDMDRSVLPVKVYIFDVADTWKRTANSTGANSEHNCAVEYETEACNATGLATNGCIDSKRVSFDMPFSGYVIYGVAHQHAAATGGTLYKEDGKPLCSSLPIYGTGEEAGNEDGYVVGMSTCYPKPGTVKISKGETLILRSNYSSLTNHTGLMGLFYLLVADQLPKPIRI